MPINLSTQKLETENKEFKVIFNYIASSCSLGYLEILSLK